ncbi:Hypothetical protein HVR_LOCUS328 [uncultured virus]|nr:Hypothetical protein HVR_LOCUS328 [uncultured virus]
MSLQEYLADNQKYVNWFNAFRLRLQTYFPELTGKIYLTGSRWFKLAYPESDLEFAAILPAEEQEEMFQRLIVYFKKTHGDAVKGTKTRAGLYLITVDNYEKEPNIWKLEMTLRTPEQQETICQHILTSLKTWSDEDKLKYIEGARHDFVNNNTESYNKRKGWLRVLPITAPQTK